MPTNKSSATPINRSAYSAKGSQRGTPRESMLITVLPSRIVMLRGLRRLSQAQLADLSGVACSTIAAIETGQTKGVNLKTLLKLCGVFEATPDYILGIRENHTLARSFATSTILSDVGTSVRRGGRCTRCGMRLRVGQPHALGKCIATACDAGQSREYLSAAFTLGIDSIDAILADEYRRRVVV
jgi:DNA-binding Xre family transcriptional regulator